MKRDGDGYTLSTGRKIYANHGLISIADQSSDGDMPETTAGAFEIGEGYDGHVYPDDYRDIEEHWSADERRELADFMIAQWQAFKDAVKD